MSEKYVEMLNELIEGIGKGHFDNIIHIPSQYTYKHLSALFLYASHLEGGNNIFRSLHRIVCEYGKSCIQSKIAQGEKVKIAFQVMSAAEWPAEALYRLLDRDERYDNYIIVCPWNDRSENDILHIYNQTCEYFDADNYHVYKAYDIENRRFLTWEEIGGIPDVLIHVSSWYESIPEQYQIEALPLSCVNYYIPYGIYVAENRDGTYMQRFGYNKQIMNLVYRLYADSLINYTGYKQYQLLEGKNVRYSGYAKMDYFYTAEPISEVDVRTIWKIPEGVESNQVKKVIIAPHHAMSNKSLVAYSTFHKNAFFWEYLAKKYEGRVSFIFKPHPNLRTKAVGEGVFDNYEVYDEYIARLDALTNVKVVQEDGYLDVFATSDAMIMDSGSFIAEYAYVNKPLLFLRRPEQAFNRLGAEIMQNYYTANGEDYFSIENFLEQVVLGENDNMMVARAEVWEKNLDYVGYNGCLASEYIYNDICSLLV